MLADVVEDGGKQTLAMLADTGHHDAIFIKADVSKTEDVEAGDRESGRDLRTARLRVQQRRHRGQKRPHSRVRVRQLGPRPGD